MLAQQAQAAQAAQANKPLATLTGEAARQFLESGNALSSASGGAIPGAQSGNIQSQIQAQQQSSPAYNSSLGPQPFIGTIMRGDTATQSRAAAQDAIYHNYQNNLNSGGGTVNYNPSIGAASIGSGAMPQGPTAAPNYGLPVNNGSGQWLSPNTSWNNMINTIAPQGQLKDSLRFDNGLPGTLGANQMVNTGVVPKGYDPSSLGVQPGQVNTAPAAAPQAPIAGLLSGISSTPLSSAALAGESGMLSGATPAPSVGPGGVGGGDGSAG